MSTCKQLEVTGHDLCPFLMKIARRLVFVPTYDSTGALNNFPDAESVNKVNIQEKLDETNPLDRFYALPLMENVEDLRAETVFFEWNSGQKVRIRKGSRTFIASLPEGDPQLLSRLQSWSGQNFGCYIIDKIGNFIYNFDDTGVIKPIGIDGQSFDVTLVKANDAEPFYLMIQFDFLEDISDGDLRYLANDTLDFDGRTQDLYGLQALYISMVTQAEGVTTDVLITTDYGLPITGLVFGDFTMYDIVTDTDLAVTAADESPTIAGQYELTSTTTVADDLTRVTVAKEKFQSAAREFTPTA